MYLPKIIDAVGVFIYCKTSSRYLFLLRNDLKNNNHWGLTGGKIESNETIIDAINRECKEELGLVPPFNRLVPIEKFTSPDGKFNYHTFHATVEEEFLPLLNKEHNGYAWINKGSWPKPLHPGLWSTIRFDEINEKMNLLETT